MYGCCNEAVVLISHHEPLGAQYGRDRTAGHGARPSACATARSRLSSVQKGEDAPALAQRAAREFPDDERVEHHHTIVEQRRESAIPASQMVHPDGRIDQDHDGRRVRCRRRGAAAAAGSVAPRAARRRALSRAIRARNPA